MVTYSFKEIGNAIYNKLLDIRGVRVGAVYNHDIKIENGISLPAIIITPDNGTINLLDSCGYEQNMVYTVRCIDRIQDGIAETEDNLREVADIVLTKLKELGTITWSNNNGYTVSCDFTYNWGFADTQEPLRVFEVNARFRAIQK